MLDRLACRNWIRCKKAWAVMSFRILSLDGGGYRGLLASLMLVELQKEIDRACEEKGIPEKRIIDCFDLIAGTSTGSLIAAALSVGRSASEIRDIFINDGATIFPRQTWLSLLFSLKHGPLFVNSYMLHVTKRTAAACHAVRERWDLTAETRSCSSAPGFLT